MAAMAATMLCICHPSSQRNVTEWYVEYCSIPTLNKATHAEHSSVAFTALVNVLMDLMHELLPPEVGHGDARQNIWILPVWLPCSASLLCKLSTLSVAKLCLSFDARPPRHAKL